MTLRYWIYYLVVFLLIDLQSFGQIDKIYISRSYHDLDWGDFEAEVEQAFDIRFYYHPDSLPHVRISVPEDSIQLLSLLDNTFIHTKIYVSYDRAGNIFLTKGDIIQTALPADFFQVIEERNQEDASIKDQNEEITHFINTFRDFIPENVVVGTRKEGLNASKHSVWGYVTSSEDGKPVPQASLMIEETRQATSSIESGYYKFTLEKGSYTLVVSNVGSYKRKYKLQVLSDGRLDIQLEPRIFVLDEVVIRSDRYHNVRGTQLGFEKLSTKDIKEIPVVLGEKDIIKVALMLPGIQSVGEGSSGFNVRGSPADQNLFYLNHVPVYNPAHLFGFFSSFNSDAISDFALYKGHIPARFGSRLSSIFDITAKQGNMQKFSARGGISSVAGRLMVEGPFKKDKSSYLVSVRSTYSDWMLKLVRDVDIRNSSASFGDAITNFTFKINPKNQLSLLTYYSHDKANIANKTENTYQNAGASLTWRHLFKNNHDLTMVFTHNDYGFEEKNMELEMAAYKQKYRLLHDEFRLSFVLRPSNKHELYAGFNSILYHVDKGDFLPLNNESLIQSKTFEPEKGLESAIYISDDWKITPRFELSGGLRYNIYNYLGPKTIFKYQTGEPREISSITDTLQFTNNAFIKTYNGLDFRFASKYLVSDNLSLKASYDRLHQYVFLLSNTIAISPVDKWKLADYHIKPVVGDQYSAGVYSNFMGNLLEVSVEAYYKKADNLVEYKDGADLVINEVPEIDVIQGELKSYGIEFMLKKPYGDFSGWINYTYSRTRVLVDNKATGEQNNFGIAYPANYDKPHALNLVAIYKFSRRFSISGNVVYSTGRPITYPVAIYYQNGQQITHYSMRNEYRIPDYFRVDISFNFEGNLKAKKFIHSSWSMSVYNLTGRKNAYSVYFKSDNGVIKGYKLAVFGSPIFSISYNFKLGNYAD